MAYLLYIDEARVKELLNWTDAFKAVETALKAGITPQTIRSYTTCVNNRNNALLTMPGHLLDDKYGALGCKLVTVFENNSKRTNPLPNILANIILLDDQTGQLKAVTNKFNFSI